MTYFLVYKTTHIPTGRFYIGRHVTDDLNDGYFGSGTILRRLLKAHHSSEFIRETLFLAQTGEEMLSLEEQEIHRVLNLPLCLNCTIGDPRTSGSIRHSDETKRKMSVAGKIAAGKRTPETCLKISIANTGKVASIETRQKLSILRKGVPRPESFSIKLSESNRKRESWKAMAEARRGTHHSEETKKKISETKRKNSEARKAQNG